MKYMQFVLVIFFSLILSACGGGGGSSKPKNQTPSASSQSLTVESGIELPITLSGSDPDGDPLTYSVVSNPNNGSLTGTAPNLTYTSNSGYVGADSFTFTVNDGTATSAVATISIDVTTNPPSFTSNASVTVNENTTVTGYVATATDPNGEAITFSVSGGSDEALFVFDPATGALSFQTAPDFENPTDSDANNIYEIDISATDGTLTVVQNVTVTINNIFEATVSSAGVKTIQFDWDDYTGATHYKLYVDSDGISGLSLLQDNLTGLSTTVELAVHKTDWVNSRYVIAAFDATGELSQASPIEITDLMLSTIGYFKATNTNSGDEFGSSVSLSADGKTMVIGAPLERSNSAGVNGDQLNNLLWNSGAAYVFVRAGNDWIQQAYIKASNPGSDDQFGTSVSLSADGNTLVVGAPYEDSTANGINGVQTDGSSRSGAVYAFVRSAGVWSQQAYIKSSNSDTDDQFGTSVSLSSDGNTLAVGAYWESSDAKGINGDQTNNLVSKSGAVYVFARVSDVWSQEAYVKASNTDTFDFFGYSLDISADGNTLAVGSYQESSDTTGVNGDETNNLSFNSGAAYIFIREGSLWSQQAYIKASNTDDRDYFGVSLSISGDGNTLAIGAHGEGSIATGVNGDQTDNSVLRAGAVYLYNRVGSLWSQNAYIKASNTGAEDYFGYALSFSADGNTLAIGAGGEDSSATGVNGNQVDNSTLSSGAVYLFSLNTSGWSQKSYIKGGTAESSDVFGNILSLSSDGNTLAAGSYCEDSAATGVNGDQTDNTMPCAGAVFMY